MSIDSHRGCRNHPNPGFWSRRAQKDRNLPPSLCAVEPLMRLYFKRWSWVPVAGSRCMLRLHMLALGTFRNTRLNCTRLLQAAFTAVPANRAVGPRPDKSSTPSPSSQPSRNSFQEGSWAMRLEGSTAVCLPYPRSVEGASGWLRGGCGPWHVESQESTHLDIVGACACLRHSKAPGNFVSTANCPVLFPQWPKSAKYVTSRQAKILHNN